MTGGHLTRRALARGVLGAGAAGLAARASAQSLLPTRPTFPAGFRWGTATSAYQIEGAVTEDGRGPSIWDTFCKEPGRIRDGTSGDVADDHYHRYREDVALMKALGVATYRFSIAWPRVFPEGRGAANPKGLDFYDRLVDALLESGIEPWATLFHWDLPQALQDKGGWESRDTVQAFADYAGHVGRRLGDRVPHWFTLNEMKSFIDFGYGTGTFAPGLKVGDARRNQARHNAVLAHGLAVLALRAARPGLRVGMAENMHVVLPAIEDGADIEAAAIATREINAPYLTVLMEGRYTDLYLRNAGADAPRFTDEEMRIIGTPLDFVGLNIYAPDSFVRASDREPGFTVLPLPRSYPHMLTPWLKFGPRALYWSPRLVSRLWSPKEIYITENGTSASDVPTDQGSVEDTDRVLYLREYLDQLQRAIADGAPVRGYFLWSLLDNFEWTEGHAVRFGLHHVDYDTQRRTPKLSAAFYKRVIARNALV